MKNTWITLSVLTLSLGFGLSPMARADSASSGATGAGLAGYQEGPGHWNEPPSEYREAQRQGYRDGIQAARMDAERHRHKDADDHQMYRHPRVERSMRDEYREGFRNGYDRAMHHMREEGHHDHDDHN